MSGGSSALLPSRSSSAGRDRPPCRCHHRAPTLGLPRDRRVVDVEDGLGGVLAACSSAGSEPRTGRTTLMPPPRSPDSLADDRRVRHEAVGRCPALIAMPPPWPPATLFEMVESMTFSEPVLGRRRARGLVEDDGGNAKTRRDGNAAAVASTAGCVVVDVHRLEGQRSRWRRAQSGTRELRIAPPSPPLDDKSPFESVRPDIVTSESSSLRAGAEAEELEDPVGGWARRTVSLSAPGPWM